MHIAAKTVSMKDIYPVAAVFGKVAVSRKGPLTVGWELTYPVSYTTEEEEYDEMIENFASAVRVLPEWAVVHKQDIFLYDHYDAPGDCHRSFLEESFNRHNEERRSLTSRTYLFVTVGSRYVVDKSVSASGIFGIRGDVVAPSQSEFKRFLGKCEEFISIFCTSGKVKARVLTEVDWLGDGGHEGIVQRYLMLGRDNCLLSDVTLNPESVIVHGCEINAFTIGDSDCLPREVSSIQKVSSLSTINTDVYLSFGARLGALLDCEHIVNQYIVVPNQAEVLSGLDKERRKMFSGLKAVDNRLNGQEIADFLDDVYRDGLFTVKSHLNVLAWNTVEDETDITAKLSSALHSMNINATFDTHDVPVVWYAGCPGASFDLGRENYMTSELKGFLALAPYESFEKDVEGGCLRLTDRTRNVPIRIDTLLKAREAGWVSNYNTTIFGGSGTGKSFFTNLYVQNIYDWGGHIFIIDVGDSYEGLCHLINEETDGRDGQYLSWDKDHPFSFNPFIGYREWLGEDGSLHTDDNGVNFFLSFLQSVWQPDGGWAPEQKTILMQIVSEFIRKLISDDDGRVPVFNDFYEYVDREIVPRICYVAEENNRTREEIDEDYRRNGYFCGTQRVTPDILKANNFIIACKQYALGGAYAFLLNDPAPKDLFRSRFTVFEVDRLSQDDKSFYSICILCIMNAFERKMRGTPEFKLMVIEEAWKAIANEAMGSYLANLWKTARKFNTSACVVTQEIADVITSPIIKTAIMDNSSIKILLDQSNHLSTLDGVLDVMSISKRLKPLILSINRALNPRYRYKEVFIDLEGKKSGVYAVEASREQAIAFESAKDKKAPFLELAKNLGSYRKAIETLVNQQ